MRPRKCSGTRIKIGGREGIRTPDPLLAKRAGQNTKQLCWCRLHENQRDSRSLKCPEVVPNKPVGVNVNSVSFVIGRSSVRTEANDNRVMREWVRKHYLVCLVSLPKVAKSILTFYLIVTNSVPKSSSG